MNEKAKATLKGLVIAQYGTVSKFNEAYGQKFQPVSYLTMRTWLDNIDDVKLSKLRQIISMLDINNITNPAALLNLQQR